MSRPSWDEYFMEIVGAVSKRSTCDRGMCGCIFVRDNQILASGYAGAPPGFPHCDDAGHQLEGRFTYIEPPQYAPIVLNLSQVSVHCIRTLHAEQNAILQAAKRGISLDDSTLYVNMTPCRNCSMSLIGVGVKRIVCRQKSKNSPESEKMLKEAEIRFSFMYDDIIKYKTDASST